MNEQVKKQVYLVIGAAIFAMEWESNRRSRSNVFRVQNGREAGKEELDKWKRELKARCIKRAEEAFDAFF